LSHSDNVQNISDLTFTMLRLSVIYHGFDAQIR